MATLYCLTNDELKEYLALEKDFQAKIVYSFLTKGVTDFSLMTSLPKATRERISKEHPSALSSKVIRRSSSDSALKLAVELEDEFAIGETEEGVLEKIKTVGDVVNYILKKLGE